MKRRNAWAWVGALCLLLTVSLSADTLVLRDGRRVDGQLVSIRDGVVEFDVQRGLFRRERVRISQAEVAEIAFDEFTASGQSLGGNNSGSSETVPSRPSGLRERSVTVNASEAWRDTGVTLRAGQTVYFAASGRVRWGPGRQDGPGGERGSAQNDARPMPNRPGAALIGRIGESDDYFFVGEDTNAIRVRNSGRLFLGVNDDYLQDNSGSFRVTVYY